MRLYSLSGLLPCLALLSIVACDRGAVLSRGDAPDPAGLIRLTDDRRSYSICKNAGVFVDRNARMEIADVAELPPKAMRKFDQDVIPFGNNRHTVWLKFTVSNPGEAARWLLVSEYPWIYDITLYARAAETSQSFEARTPVATERWRPRKRIFELDFAPGQQTSYYIRFRSNVVKIVDLWIEDPLQFHIREGNERAGYAAFFALMGVMLVATILLFIRTRSGLLPLYAMFLVCAIIWQAGISGFGLSYFFDASTRNNSLGLLVSSGGVTIFTVLFWQRLLFLKIHAPLIHRLLSFSLAIGALMLLLMIWPDSNLAFLSRVGKLITIATAATIIIAGLRCSYLGFRPAHFSATGISVYFGCIAVWFASTLAYLPNNNWINLALFGGYLVEALLFFVSFSKRQIILEELRDATGESPAPVHYQKSRLHGLDTKELVRRLDDLMRTERIFCDEDASLESVARALDLNPHQLSELLNNVVGKSFRRYLNDFRIAEARQLLRAEPRRSIQSIANSVGFQSRSSFHIHFKSAVGLSANEFRKSAPDFPAGKDKK